MDIHIRTPIHMVPALLADKKLADSSLRLKHDHVVE